MKIVFLRVGIDAGCGGRQGPILNEAGEFEFLPIPQYSGPGRTYGTLPARYQKTLSEYFPEPIREVWQNKVAHNDPEFETFTYGDPTTPKRGLANLEKGDVLVFYAGLEGVPPLQLESHLYIVGYFVIEIAAFSSTLDASFVRSAFANNAHVINGDFDREPEKLLLVKGDPDASRRLRYAKKISKYGVDKRGTVLKVLSDEMALLTGGFTKTNSIQRSIPRIVQPENIQATWRFLRSLE